MKNILSLAAVLCCGSLVLAQGPGPTTSPRDVFRGYDFGQVIEALETSVTPLQREMDQSFKVFLESMKQAEALLDQGKTQEGMQKASAAIDTVLAVKDKVLAPMWDGQQALMQQTALVRARLARAVAAMSRAQAGTSATDRRTEEMLDEVAKRIATETDDLRKKRLVAHYRTVRNLARIRAMSEQLSPHQRALWHNVLQVLDQAALAHQQVLMGSEVLFAQFEASAANLKEYIAMMETVQGAKRLLDIVRGDGRAGGMDGFITQMQDLQSRVGSFGQAVEQTLQSGLDDLEKQVNSITPPTGGVDLAGNVVMSAEEDQELTGRIRRLGQPPAVVATEKTTPTTPRR